MTQDAPEEAPKGESNAFAGMDLQEAMMLYYARIFPFEEMVKWLAYGNDGKHAQADASFLPRREFCFTLQGDIFARYQSFKDVEALRSAVLERCPTKIDIGPIYNVEPSRRAAYSGSSQGFAPEQRELVFDIDLTDYDDVRTCGKEGHICRQCWPLMAVAIKVLDRGLREDFGFEHILWVYSGRRGVHAWICDERARVLSDEQRSAIASYFCLYKGTVKGVSRLAVGPEDHPSVQRAVELLHPAFVRSILPRQRLLSTPDTRARALAGLPSERLRDRVASNWAAVEAAFHKGARGAGAGAGAGAEDYTGAALETQLWRTLEEAAAKEATALAKARDMRGARAAERAVRDFVLTHAYPRLDVEVSRKMNHLLKAPFCVHPKTGRVCVPIDPARADEFDPEAAPTVGQLLAQLNARAQGGARWDGTDLEPVMREFQTGFLDALAMDARNALAAKARASAAQPTLAW